MQVSLKSIGNQNSFTNYKKMRILDISDDVLCHHLVCKCTFIDFYNIRRTCRRFNRLVEMQLERYRSYVQFYEQLPNLLSPPSVSTMFYNRSQFRTPSYQTVSSEKKSLNWEQFEYVIWNLSERDFGTIWRGLITDKAYRAEVHILKNEKLDFERVVLRWIYAKPQVFLHVGKWIAEFLPDLYDYISDQEELILKLISNGAEFLTASKSLRTSRDFILKVLDCCDLNLKYLSTVERSDYEIVLKTVKINPLNYCYVSETLKGDKSVVMEMIRSSQKLKTPSQGKYVNKTLVELFKMVPEHLLDDRQVIFSAVDKDPTILQFASDRMKKDRDIVLKVVQISGTCIAFVHPDLLDDKLVCIESIKHAVGTNRRIVLGYINNLLFFDRTFMKDMVAFDGMLLEYAPNFEIANDRNIVLEAVKQNGFSLQFASQQLRNDVEIVKEATKSEPESLEFASSLLRDDFDLVLNVVRKSKQALVYASPRLRDDEKIVTAAVESYPFSIRFASTRLRNDKSFLNKLISKSPTVTNFLN